MNTKIKFTRFVFALVLALGTLGVSATTALADTPSKSEFSFTYSFDSQMCAFPVKGEGTVSMTWTDYFDKDGVKTWGHWHAVEVDTFTANGKTLVGSKYVSNFTFRYDSSGNMTIVASSGIFGKMKLPDKSLVITVGHIDWVKDQWGGHDGDWSGVCAALAP